MLHQASHDKPFVRFLSPAIILLGVAMCLTLAHASSPAIHGSQNPLTVEPPSLVIAVGQSGNANVTLTESPPAYGLVCFAVEGFPTSGFVTSFKPECANMDSTGGPIKSVLTVEATPAAAPQSFSAFVVVGSGNWTERAEVNITVTPAMPAWIPWSIIFAFILLLISPFVVARIKRNLRKYRS